MKLIIEIKPANVRSRKVTEEFFIQTIHHVVGDTEIKFKWEEE